LVVVVVDDDDEDDIVVVAVVICAAELFKFPSPSIVVGQKLSKLDLLKADQSPVTDICF
jgi:hypothetical protein